MKVNALNDPVSAANADQFKEESEDLLVIAI